MRISNTLLGALLVGLWASACGDSAGSQPPPLRPGDAKAGLETANRKCLLCHSYNGRGGNLALPMEQSVAKTDPWLADYPARAKALEAADPKVYQRNRASIDRVAAESDPRKRFELWISSYLANPKFDNPASRMTPLHVPAQENADVAAWLWTLRGAH